MKRAFDGAAVKIGSADRHVKPILGTARVYGDYGNEFRDKTFVSAALISEFGDASRLFSTAKRSFL